MLNFLSLLWHWACFSPLFQAWTAVSNLTCLDWRWQTPCGTWVRFSEGSTQLRLTVRVTHWSSLGHFKWGSHQLYKSIRVNPLPPSVSLSYIRIKPDVKTCATFFWRVQQILWTALTAYLDPELGNYNIFFLSTLHRSNVTVLMLNVLILI